MMKRFVCMLLVLLCLLGCAAAEKENMIDPGPLPDFVEPLLAIAHGELGYVEGTNNFSNTANGAAIPTPPGARSSSAGAWISWTSSRERSC